MSAKGKGFRKIPHFVEARLSSLGDPFFIAVVKRIGITELMSGKYAHLGLSWFNGQVQVAASAPPPIDFGRYARRNIVGQEIVRRDLPKISKTITFVNPRLFGRPGNVCTITQVRDVYQRDHLAPRLHSVESSVLLANVETCIVRFAITGRQSRSAPHFDRELLFGLSLLQECAGGVNVFATDATTQDYLGSIQVHWEILPAGERDKNIVLILSSFHPKDQAERDALEQRANDRYDFFETLGPKHIIRGTGGLNGYMGALIQDDIVVFEHLTPGNGIYILFADWATQSQRTKTDLLTHAEKGKDFLRITHTGDWQLRVRNAIAQKIQ